MGNPLNINPNRMELMKLSKRLSLARRGHRLLKDKQDNLMDRFTKVIKDVRIVRRELEELYKKLKIPYFISKHISDPETFNSFRRDPVVQASVSGGHSRVMNLIIPELAVKFSENIDALGNLNLSSVFPEFLKEFFKLSNKIVDLINAEKKMYLIAEELQKVRRRVNALEYIFIPKLEETHTYITMQLEEMERETNTRLMKIKDIVRKAR